MKIVTVILVLILASGCASAFVPMGDGKPPIELKSFGQGARASVTIGPKTTTTPDGVSICEGMVLEEVFYPCRTIEVVGAAWSGKWSDALGIVGLAFSAYGAGK